MIMGSSGNICRIAVLGGDSHCHTPAGNNKTLTMMTVLLVIITLHVLTYSTATL